MIGALSPHLALPLDTPTPEEPANLAGSPCCPSPYCAGCTVANFLTDEDTRIMRRHLARLLARPAARVTRPR